MLGEVSIPTGPTNLRDVRGLRTDDGGLVCRGALYRSEVPRPEWTEQADVAVWPPGTVVDLRSAQERTAPHPLADVATVHTVPLGASLAPALAAEQTSDPDLDWAYRHLVADAAAEIARIVRIVAGGPGPVLVHCTAGKDRTGIVLAVLLRAVGVRRADIMADYLRTEANLPKLWAVLRAAGMPFPRNEALLGVQAAALDAVLDAIEAAPGGIQGWLSEHGVERSELQQLSARLLLRTYAPAPATDFPVASPRP
jgi:protein-tyrosine phosphatase